MDNEKEVLDQKEDKDMAITYKPQVPLIIKPGMTKAFADALVSENRPKNYWEECKKTVEKINSLDRSAIEKLNRMARGEE